MSVRRRTSPAGAPRWRHLLLAGLPVSAALLLAACSGSSTTDSAVCDDETTDPLDPQSVVHVLPGAPTPPYGDELPTSGIHVMDPRIEVVVEAPLEPAIAVGVLERSGVVIEYRPGIDDDDRATLEELATDEMGTVVVAPAPDLPAPIVARAWQTTLRCEEVDRGRLETFVDDHLGSGSAMDDADG